MPGQARVLHARLARQTRTYNKTKDPADAARVNELRRDFIAEALAEHIEAVVSKAPPLTPAQLSRLRSLLDVGGAA